jgi:hypothetical protein
LEDDHGRTAEVRHRRDEYGISFTVFGEVSDFMGNDTGVIIRFTGAKGDDIALLQCGGIADLLNKDDIACTEIGFAHGIGSNDEKLPTEDVAVIFVQRCYGEKGKYDHDNGNGNYT